MGKEEEEEEEIVPVHVMKDCSGIRGIVPLILNFALDGDEW
jgi:hypothetical protein